MWVAIDLRNKLGRGAHKKLMATATGSWVPEAAKSVRQAPKTLATRP